MRFFIGSLFHLFKHLVSETNDLGVLKIDRLLFFTVYRSFSGSFKPENIYRLQRVLGKKNFLIQLLLINP